MEKGICIVSVAAIRAEQSHQSEMTSQILYGETVDILEKAAKFIKIKMHFDGYVNGRHTKGLRLPRPLIKKY